MKKFLTAVLLIMFSMTTVEGAARVIERGSASTVHAQSIEDGEEVRLPPMDLPSMTEPPPVEEPEEEPPFDWTEWADPSKLPKDAPDNRPKEGLPDYTEPGVETEQSKTPTTEPTQVEEVEGVEFRVMHRDGVMAFALIADHEKYELRPTLARGIIPGRGTVKSMSGGTLAAINASYFGLSGEIYGVTKIDRTIVGTTYYTRSAMGINVDGSTIFGRVSYRGVLRLNGAEVNIGGVNCERSADSLVIYNKYFGATTRTNKYGTEAVIAGDGEVLGVHVDIGNAAIPSEGYVISGHGKMAAVLKNLREGDYVEFVESIIDEDGAGDFDAAEHVIGAGPRLVKDGKVYVNVVEEEFPSDIRVGRAPRSAVGVTQYGDYIFAVVDGRQAHSRGCTLHEWATILLKDFGAVNAINLDGGGSTELVVKDNIVNSPSDGRERPVADALILVKKK